MAYDERLAARIREVLRGQSRITERKMFGGVAFLCDGRMCCGVAGPDLVVRVIEAEMPAALSKHHVRPMDLTGRPLRGFVFVSPGGCRTAAALQKWVANGLRFVEQTYGDSRRHGSRGSNVGASTRRTSRPHR